MNSSRRALPPTYLFISMLAMVLLHFFIPVLQLIQYPWFLLGLAPLSAGIILNLVADAAFKKAKTTVKPFQLSSALITDGVFRISRHPMYFGMVLILLGIAMLLGSLSPLLIVFVFALIMELVFIRAEESMLAQQFGSDWHSYRNKVRKWV